MARRKAPTTDHDDVSSDSLSDLSDLESGPETINTLKPEPRASRIKRTSPAKQKEEGTVKEEKGTVKEEKGTVKEEKGVDVDAASEDAEDDEEEEEEEEEETETGTSRKRQLTRSPSPPGKLSTYELQRLENIRKNQQILKEMDIQKAVPKGFSAHRAPPAKRAKTSKTYKKDHDFVPPPERKSSRLQSIKAPSYSEAALQANAELQQLDNAVDHPKKAKRKGAVPFSFDNEGVNEKQFANLVKGLQTTARSSQSLEDASKEIVVTETNDQELRKSFELLTVLEAPFRLTNQRIVTVDVHPDNNKCLIAAGDRRGQLGICDMRVGQDNPKDQSERVYVFSPHDDAISDIKFGRDSNQMYSSSYDGTIRIMDINKSEFSELYRNPAGDEKIHSMSHHPTSANIWFSLDDGHLVNLDPRENKPMYYDVGEGKKIACIHVNPTQPDYIACSGLNYAIDVFDARKMKGSSTSEANAAVGDAVWHEDTGRAVSGCYWNPLGTQLATTSHDNTVRLWSHLTDSEAVDSHVIQHNNFTGRWITAFRARWSPQGSAVIIGNMKRAIDVYSARTGNQISLKFDHDFVPHIPSVNLFHPTWRDGLLMVSGNASGKCYVWGDPKLRYEAAGEEPES